MLKATKKDRCLLRAYIGVKPKSTVSRGNLGKIYTELERGGFVHCGRVCSYLTEKQIMSDVKNGYLIPYNPKKND